MREQPVRIGLGEEVQEADIMVAGKRDDPGVLAGRPDQEIDHAFGIGAAVDIVAEMDDAPVGDGLAVAVLDDRVIHLEQQVEPAVHVADRIDAQVFRPLRVEEMDAGRCHRYPPTTMMCRARGPCAPRMIFCSTSPERDGPEIRFTRARHLALAVARADFREHRLEIAGDVGGVDHDDMMLGQEVDGGRIVRCPTP